MTEISASRERRGAYTVRDDDLADAAALTQTLVAVPTESPAGERYPEFVDLLEHELRVRIPDCSLQRLFIPREAYDAHPRLREAIKGDRVILLARFPAPGKSSLHINDHYDVVPAGDPARWTVTAPFSPRIVNDRIYGRGACDSKGSIAALIEALAIVRRERRPLAYDLTVSFTPDEEISSYSGLLYLIDRTRAGDPYLDADAFLAVDGHQNHISIGKVGLIRFEIQIIGRASHIARSFTATNAVHLAAPVLDALLELRGQVERRSSAYPGNPDLPLGRVRPNLVVTAICGGSPAEVVPDRCVISGSRTVLPDESPAPMDDASNELVTAILDVRQRYQIPMTFRVEAALPPFITSADVPPVRRMREVAARKPGSLFPAACSEGFNEITLVTTLGIPVFARGVQTPDCNVHMPDENVPLHNLRVGIEDLVGFLGE